MSNTLRTLEQLRSLGKRSKREIANTEMYEDIVFASDSDGEDEDELNRTFIAKTNHDMRFTNPKCIGAKPVANYGFFDPKLLESFMQCAGVKALHCSNCTCELCVHD